MYEASPADYRAVDQAPAAGDTLLLAAGEYRDGLALHEVVRRGRPADRHRGTRRRAPPRRSSRAPDTTRSASSDSHHRGDSQSGARRQQPPGRCGEGRRNMRVSAHHITLENLVIRGHGNNQQTVGISTKCPAWNWVIRGVTIIGAGTGMYLGDSNGNAPFVAGLIERNVIVDSIGYNLQIKHQLARPDLPGMPGRTRASRSSGTTSSPSRTRARAEAARPNVLVGHFPREGRGAEDDLRDLRQLLLPESARGVVPGRGQRRALRERVRERLRRCACGSSRTTTCRAAS